MADTATSQQAPCTSGAAHTKQALGGQKKSNNARTASNHPPTPEMANNAIKNLKEGGRKFLAGT